MKLYGNDASPFVRKVLVAASETGLRDRIDYQALAVVPTQHNAEMAAVNPLMKIPTLIADDGAALFDSRVICEYLDTLHQGRKLVPAAGPDRWRVLRFAAMCDGMLDAGLLVRYEHAFRPKELHWEVWLEAQRVKSRQALDQAARELNPAEPINLGQIALACAIGWLELRKPLGDIRPGRDKLFAWYEQFIQRPSMQATLPKG